MKKLLAKQKLLNTLSTHSKLFTLGVGLALILAIGTTIGMLDHAHTVFAAGASSSGASAAAAV